VVEAPTVASSIVVSEPGYVVVTEAGPVVVRRPTPVVVETLAGVDSPAEGL
jgi:hypothetical protein